MDEYEIPGVSNLDVKSICDQLTQSLTDAYGDRDYLDIDVGIDVALEQGIVVHDVDDPAKEPACYSPAETGYIEINWFYGYTTMAISMVHENCHHMLWRFATYCPEELNGLWGIIHPLQTEADARKVRHAICDIVTARILKEFAPIQKIVDVQKEVPNIYMFGVPLPLWGK